jgi:amino acid transporter
MPTWAVSLFGLGCMMAAVVVYMVGVMVVSRIIFAWSFDRMIPSIFAQVSEKYKTPYVGLLVASVFSIVLYVFEIFAPQYTFFGALSFFVLINVFIVTICGMVFPFVRKDMFELMPLKARIAGIPLLSIISFFGLLLTCLVSTAYFTNPNFMISFGVTYNAVGYAAAIWILGMIYYFADRAYNKRRGINLDIAFKQIPPA